MLCAWRDTDIFFSSCTSKLLFSMKYVGVCMEMKWMGIYILACRCTIVDGAIIIRIAKLLPANTDGHRLCWRSTPSGVMKMQCETRVRHDPSRIHSLVQQQDESKQNQKNGSTKCGSFSGRHTWKYTFDYGRIFFFLLPSSNMNSHRVLELVRAYYSLDTCSSADGVANAPFFPFFLRSNK